MANLRAAQKEMTRRRLLSTALELFQEKGYTGTTIDEIAAAAGTTRVTFYAHFPSRDGVMRELLDELNEILERPASQRGSTSTGLVEAVRAGTRDAIRPWLDEQVGHWPHIKPYILVATEAAAVDSDLRAVFHSWWDEVIADIREGLDAADRFPAAERRFRAHLAMSLLDQAALEWMRDGEGDAPLPLRVDVLTEAWAGIIGRGR
ncbi:TetR/AcrR family transcriptional regulator [Microbacterium sp. NPDC096154]|uniref:TetR/AcrR family transcriptional regulator n=1 Tax=Microbacterium sp. NPDC096154 TaxID=3155549 RepID=UPI00332B5D7D